MCIIHHINITRDLKVLQDQKKLKDRCLCLVQYLRPRCVERYYLRTLSIEESLYSAPKSGLDRLLGCD